MKVVREDVHTSSLDDSPVWVFIALVFINKIHQYIYIILALHTPKLFLMSFVHKNLVFGLSRCFIGAISSVLLKAHDSFFTNPNQLLTPKISLGL